MIVTCSCGAKLKIGDDKLTGAGVRIKCPKCGAPHFVRKPAADAAVPSAAPAMPWFAPAPGGVVAPSVVARPDAAVTSVSAAAPAPTAAPAMPWFAATSGAPADAAPGTTPVVLVAHDSKVVVDMIRSVVSDSGMLVVHAPNGLEALKKASELKPQVMIVDVGLTGIYGFELCERLKGDPDTRGIKIILLSSVYGLTAYKRSPVTLYGADDYIEKHHIPDGLAPKIKELLAGRSSGAPTAAPAAAPPETDVRPAPRAAAPAASPQRSEKALKPERSAATEPASAERPSRPAAAAPPPSARPIRPAAGRIAAQDESIKLNAAFFEQDEYVAPAPAPVRIDADPAEVEKARRFARIVVSDIALYNQEAVAEGIAKGTFFDLLKEDIAEGRALYDKRVPEAIRASKDYFQEAFDNFIEAKKKQR